MTGLHQTPDVELQLSERSQSDRRVVRITEPHMLGQRVFQELAGAVEVEAIECGLTGVSASKRGHQDATAAIEMRRAFQKQLLRVGKAAAQLLCEREMPRRETDAPRVVDGTRQRQTLFSHRLDVIGALRVEGTRAPQRRLRLATRVRQSPCKRGRRIEEIGGVSPLIQTIRECACSKPRLKPCRVLGHIRLDVDERVEAEGEVDRLVRDHRE